MNPETYAEKNTEHAHQTALFMWASSQLEAYPCLAWMYAVPNGGDRNPIVAARLKAEGVKSGVSDICLPFARMGYHGFYIEMKKPKGKESTNQIEFGKFLIAQNYLYSMFDHWAKARDGILWYLQNDPPF
jgi:hypothetical protein